MNIQRRLIWLIMVTFLSVLMAGPQPAQAQWPPFNFRLSPRYDNGKIIYKITFSSSVDWTMTDLTFNIPLPPGTRFVEASPPPTTIATFDGAEVSFVTSAFHRPIRDVYFTVEVTDPAMTVFTTHAWISWKGEHAGDYLTKDVSIDITAPPPLDWRPPPKSRLQLEIGATVADNIITYAVYPTNTDRRMWDLKINVPIPEGTTFLSAEAPPAFVTNFDGREVTFTIVELEWQAEVGPLIVKVSTEGVTAPTVITHAWATWKNVGRNVGISVVSQEETRTGDIIVQPNVYGWIASDPIGDVPFPDYDLTSLAFQDDGNALKIDFHTVAAIGPIGEPLEYNVNIDSDCRSDTGSYWGNYLGAEYLILYDHAVAKAKINAWDQEKRKWSDLGKINVNNPAGGNIVSMLVPHELLEDSSRFCWTGWAKNFNEVYSLPHDEVQGIRLAQYEFVGKNETPFVIENESSVNNPATGAFINVGDVWQYLPGWSEPASTWKSVDFDDSDWFSGPTSIGYGDNKYATDLSLITPVVQSNDTPALVSKTITETGVTLVTLPSGEVVSVFMRHTFPVSNPTLLSQLLLEVDYEGGFVAYLNGLEVARHGLGEPGSPVLYNTTADQEASSPATIDLSNAINNLVTGPNVLAIQLHRPLDSYNLSIAPKLTWVSDPANPALLVETDASPPVSLPSASLAVGLQGKLAVPLNNGYGFYDVHIFSLPDGQEIARIPNARQPNLRFDGQRLLINREGGGAENVFEYNLVDGTEKQVSDAPRDSQPFYDSWGNRVVYANPELTYGKPEAVYKENKWYHTGVHKPFIFVQCGLLPPHQEKEPRCRDIPTLGVLIPASQTSELQGTNPVWTSTDMIAYRGCNSWAGFAACGIYIVPSASTKGFSDGFIPRQLTKDSNDTPTDTKGNLIAFMSSRDSNWEAYIMDLQGQGVINLSNNPTSNDGLPTISPDDNWVAFVSDREGHWAMWVTPVAGGSAEKLFDLPVDAPWGDGDRAWTNERISWGP